MLGEHASEILQSRYLLPGETWEQLCHRVAYAVASVEDTPQEWSERFQALMLSLDFIPAGRTLCNAGAPTKQKAEAKLVSNCVVLSISEGQEFNILYKAALLHSAGSGVGFPFHLLKPAEFGFANGPVAILNIYSLAFKATENVVRPPANMAVMRIDHPDILEFIEAKRTRGLENFNISLALTDNFMNRLSDPTPWVCQWQGKPYKPREILRDPQTGRVLKITELTISAGELFAKICWHAWNNGEPGCVFIDTVNKSNPLPGLGPIECCNPCGEQYLHSGDACNLGSINLEKFVSNGQVDRNRLEKVVRLAVRFLDNVIDLTRFPVDEVQEMFTQNRRIGLGVMGLADMLILLNVHYDTEEGRAVAASVLDTINHAAHDESSRLATEKGSFKNWNKSVYHVPMRNASLTTIAPTGSTSFIADVASGLEPYFARVYRRGSKIFTNKHLAGSFDVKTSLEISAENHIKMQACLQAKVDNAISKTINFPHDATIEDVANAFKLAWVSQCKGITVYRNESRSEQVLCTCTCETCTG